MSDKILNNVMGQGTEDKPFISADGTGGIQEAINNISRRGGKVYLPCARYDISSSIKVDAPCIKLEGEVWNYSSDPNGVFESSYGTKLRLTDNNIPALSIGVNNVVGGPIITNLGFQGNIVGMDTRSLYHKEDPSIASGLHIGSTRVDQGEFSKLSFCGLATGICGSGTAFIDACRFDKFNADGCCVGVYFGPEISAYTYFQRAIIADTPSYGFFADGGRSNRIFELFIEDISFIRNCGSMPDGNDDTASAIYLKNLRSCTLRHCLIDAPGLFWYYAPDATKNEDRQIHWDKAIGIRVDSNNCRVLDNTVLRSTRESILVKGNNNIISGNIVDGNIYVEGMGNTVANTIFTSAESRLILKGSAVSTTTLIGIPEDRIVKIND